jgi:hypothetical protein
MNFLPSPVQGVLPTVYRIQKLKKRPRSRKDCRAIDILLLLLLLLLWRLYAGIVLYNILRRSRNNYSLDRWVSDTKSSILLWEDSMSYRYLKSAQENILTFKAWSKLAVYKVTKQEVCLFINNSDWNPVLFKLSEATYRQSIFNGYACAWKIILYFESMTQIASV